MLHDDKNRANDPSYTRAALDLSFSPIFLREITFARARSKNGSSRPANSLVTNGAPCQSEIFRSDCAQESIKYRIED